MDVIVKQLVDVGVVEKTLADLRMTEEEKRNDFGDHGEEVLDDTVLQNGVLLDDIGDRLGFRVFHICVLTVVDFLCMNERENSHLKEKEALTSRQDLLVCVLDHVLNMKQRQQTYRCNLMHDHTAELAPDRLQEVFDVLFRSVSQHRDDEEAAVFCL